MLSFFFDKCSNNLVEYSHIDFYVGMVFTPYSLLPVFQVKSFRTEIGLLDFHLDAVLQCAMYEADTHVLTFLKVISDIGLHVRVRKPFLPNDR